MNECCQADTNLAPPEQVDDHDGLVVRVCQVCGARHFELTVDPVDVFGEGAAL